MIVYVPGGHVFIKAVNKVSRFFSRVLVTNNNAANQLHQSDCSMAQSNVPTRQPQNKTKYGVGPTVVE